jgi:predicted small secreted protein
MFLVPAINVALAAVLVAACFTVRRDVERVKSKAALENP